MKRKDFPKRDTLEKAFWDRVNKGNPVDCWEWAGDVDMELYGRFRFNYTRYKAHRVSYEINIGPIPEGLLVCHSCDNPRCVNPNHLWIGTSKDNIQDAKAKGRLSRGDLHWTRAEPERAPRGEANSQAILTEQMVHEIRAYSGLVSTRDMVKLFGVTKHAIYDVINRRTWKHLA